MVASHRCGLVLAAVIMASCLGTVAGGSAGASPGVLPAQAAGTCPEPADPFTPADVAEVETLLVGTWVLCEGAVLSPLGPGEAGFQFDADGTLYRVYDDGAGGLIRAAGLEQQGAWSVMETGPGMFQIDVGLLGYGGAALLPDFYATPPLIETIHAFGDPASFVPWTGAPPVPGVPAGVGDGPCGLPTDHVELTSVEQTEKLLVGTWLMCAGDPLFWQTAFGEVGVLFSPDGRYFRVYEDGGALISASGPGQEGLWEVTGHPDQNGLSFYQLDLDPLDGGVISAGSPVLLEQPPHLRMFPGIGRVTDLQRTTAIPVPGAPPSPPSPPPPPAPAPPPDNELPATGSDLALTAFAIVAIGAGSLFVRWSGRPRDGRDTVA